MDKAEGFHAAVSQLELEDLDGIKLLVRAERREFLRSLAKTLGLRHGAKTAEILATLANLETSAWLVPLFQRHSLQSVVIEPVMVTYRALLGEEADDPTLETLRSVTGPARKDHGRRLVRLTLEWVVVQDFTAAPVAAALLAEEDKAADGLFERTPNPPVDVEGQSGSADSAIQKRADEKTPGEGDDATSQVAETQRPLELTTAAASVEAAQAVLPAIAANLERGVEPLVENIEVLEAVGPALHLALEVSEQFGVHSSEPGLSALVEAWREHDEQFARKAAEAEREQRMQIEELEVKRLRLLLRLRSADPQVSAQLDELAGGVELLLDDSTDDAKTNDRRASLLDLADLVGLSVGGADGGELFQASAKVQGLSADLSQLVPAILLGLVTIADRPEPGRGEKAAQQRVEPESEQASAPSAGPEGPPPGPTKDLLQGTNAPSEPQDLDPPVVPQEAPGTRSDPQKQSVPIESLPVPSASDEARGPAKLQLPGSVDQVDPRQSPTLDEIDSVLAELVASDRLALARWLLVAIDDPGQRTACLEALALSLYVDPAAPEALAAFNRATSELAMEVPTLETGWAVLSLLACAAACFRNPASLNFALLAAVEGALNRFDEVKDLVRLLEMVAKSGEVPADFLADFDQRQADLDGRAKQLVAQASEILETGPHRRILYAPATRTWQQLISPGGAIAALLDPVANDDKSQAQRIASETTALSPHSEIERLVDDTRIGLGFRKSIESKARQRIHAYVSEALEIAQAWSSYTLRSRGVSGARDQGNAGQVLRDRLTKLRPRLDALAKAWESSEDSLLAAAGNRAHGVIDEIASLLQGGELPPVRPAPVDLVLNADLLFAPTVPMNGLVPRRPPTAREILDLVVDTPTVAEAFGNRIVLQNYSSCRALLELIDPAEEPLLVELTQTLDTAVTTFRHKLNLRIGDLESSLGLAIADGLLDDAEASRIQAVLVEVDVAVEFSDHDEVLAKVDGVEAELDDLREHAIADRRLRLAELSKDQPHRSEDAARIGRALIGGSLGVADEFLALLERGDSLPQDPAESRLFDVFFPSVVDRIVKGGDASAIADGTVPIPELGRESGVTPERQRQIDEAWEAWEAIGKDYPQNVHLTRILRELGLQQAKTVEVKGSPAPDRWWFDLTASPQGDAVVPAFGSGANGNYRVLVVQDRPSPRRMTGYINADESSAAPVFVLYRGSLTSAARRDYAELIRRSSDRRSVALVDDATFLMVLRHGDRVFSPLMDCTLPFTAINPYTPFVAGQVPEEMFYGRDDERRRLLDPLGPAFVYGGRQLGKSALLRDTARRAQRQGHTALYVDLAYEGIGSFRQADELWSLLSQRLAEAGVGSATRKDVSDSFDDVRKQIENWLAEDSKRFLYVLLDECDRLLDDDFRRKFVVTQRIRGLVDTNRGRLKFILAGLHVVQRFERMPNQPLAHVASGKVVIGPMAPSDSAALIRDPLAALGYRFADPHLVYRIAAYTNNQASILQLVADRLTRRLLDRARSTDAPPYTASERDVAETFADVKLQEDIKQRFEWTIDLDRRYRVVALVTAEHAYSAGASEPMDASLLRHKCLRVWPSGFERETPESFQALLAEMDGLGVLRRISAGGWGLRTPSLLRLFGNHYDILEILDGMAEWPVDSERFDPVLAHRPMAGSELPSPLNEDQVRRLLDQRGLFLLTGSRAMGADLVPTALNELAASEYRAHNLVDVSEGRLRTVLRDATKGKTAAARLVVADLRAAPDDAARQAVEMAQQVVEGHEGVTVVFVAERPDRALLDLFEAERSMRLARWDPGTLDFWLRDLDLNLSSALLEELADLTGGWRTPLAYWNDLRHDSKGPDDALSATRTWLESTAGSRVLWDAVDLGSSKDASAGWEAIVAFEQLAPGDWSAALQSVDRSESQPGAAEGILLALGAIVEVVVDGNISYVPEPALLRSREVLDASADAHGS